MVRDEVTMSVGVERFRVLMKVEEVDKFHLSKAYWFLFCGDPIAEHTI
jgi:hypothetical protein